jgi:O-antigen/teichoic acid export membrane protein
VIALVPPASTDPLSMSSSVSPPSEILAVSVNPQFAISDSRFRYWARTLSKFVTTQVVVQAVGVASGILLVRVMDQREYAFFTLAFAMQSTMSILADTGVGIGLSSIGGRVWRDTHRFGALINTALRLRRYLAGASIIIVTPILLWMLTRNGASLGYAGLLAILVLAGFGLQLTTVVLIVVPRLHSQINRVQLLDLLAALARLALICTAYFLFLNAAMAILATVASIAVQYILLKRWTTGSIDTSAAESREDRAEITSIIKSQAPNSIFYCLQGQVTVWLIAVFGSTQAIAEVGALGRLGIAFAVVGAVMTSIVLPGFARCQSPQQLRRLYFRIVAAFVLFGLSLLTVARIFPDQLLWILGAKYAHLRNPLLLSMCLTAFSSVITAMWSLNYTKAWIKYSWLNIPGVLIAQVLLLSFLDISTLEGVLWLGILSLVPTLLLNAVLSYRGLTERSRLATST